MILLHCNFQPHCQPLLHLYNKLSDYFAVTVAAICTLSIIAIGTIATTATAEYYDPVHGTSLNGRSRIITLELSKLDKVVEKPVKEMNVQEYWAVYLEYLTDKEKRWKINEIMVHNEGIAMASEVLIRISKDDKERARLLSEYKYELDTQSKLVSAEREGIKKGIKKGIKEGRKEGRKEGMQKGEQKIIDLLKSGKSPEEIIREYGNKTH